MKQIVEESFASSPLKRQGGLAALWLSELFHPHIRRYGYVCLASWSDKNELSSNRAPSSGHLSRGLAIYDLATNLEDEVLPACQWPFSG